MKRMTQKTKKGITLVELIVAMTLTALFASSCIMLILPITQIYTHTNNLSRAELVADTVIDSLRAECAHTYIEGQRDVWISTGGASGMANQEVASGYLVGGGEANNPLGNVLVLRRNPSYCETISTNYEIVYDLYSNVLQNDDTDPEPLTDVNGVTSRSIYRMFPGGSTAEMRDRNVGYVHFGYFENGIIAGTSYIFPLTEYDFTNPVGVAAYRDFYVGLNFHDIGYVTIGEHKYPSYVLCDVLILQRNGVDGEGYPSYSTIYKRTAVLCFASPVT